MHNLDTFSIVFTNKNRVDIFNLPPPPIRDKGTKHPIRIKVKPHFYAFNTVIYFIGAKSVAKASTYVGIDFFFSFVIKKPDRVIVVFKMRLKVI